MRLGTCAIIWNRQKKKFLVQHSLKRGWELIGGKVESGEHPNDTIAYEALEEAGFNIHEISLLGAIEHEEWCCLCYSAIALPDAEPKLCEPDKVDKFAWVDSSEYWALSEQGETWNLADDVVRKYLTRVMFEEKQRGEDLCSA